MDQGIIYLITSKSGKRYVGQTTEDNYAARMRSHRNRSDNCTALNRATQKYGWDTMVVEILLRCPVAQLDDYERKLIFAYDTFGKNGYNLTSGGKHCRRHEATKRKISDTMLAYRASEAGVEANRAATTRLKRQWQQPQFRDNFIKRARAFELTERGKRARESMKKALGKKVTALHVASDTTVTFDSTTDAAKRIGCTVYLIRRCCKENRLCKGWEVSRADL